MATVQEICWWQELRHTTKWDGEIGPHRTDKAQLSTILFHSGKTDRSLPGTTTTICDQYQLGIKKTDYEI